MPRSNPNRPFTQRIAAAALIAAVHAPLIAQPTTTPEAPRQATKTVEPKLVAYAQEVPVAAYKIDMLPIPGSKEGGPGGAGIKPFYMSKTELTWEAFDVYIYRLDEEAGKGPKNADAVTRPSKPYLPPDRGFGHEGFPAISMSFKNAQEFCKWLSAQTGRTYRLPTEAEWEHAARAGSEKKDTTAGAVPDGSKLEDCAWLESNAADAPHPAGKKKPNAWGLCDMLGNVAEWVTDKDGNPVVKGGSFRDAADKVTITGNQPNSRAWNGSDPQVPKSKWWLADAPFIGFRIVCETAVPAPTQTIKPADRLATPSHTPAATPAEPENKP